MATHHKRYVVGLRVKCPFFYIPYYPPPECLQMLAEIRNMIFHGEKTNAQVKSLRFMRIDRNKELFLISNLRRVLNVVCFLGELSRRRHTTEMRKLSVTFRMQTRLNRVTIHSRNDITSRAKRTFSCSMKIVLIISNERECYKDAVQQIAVKCTCLLPLSKCV